MSLRLPQEVPLISLPNWVKAAAACGFSIESVFADLRIEADLMHVESATISGADMERLMSACVARSGPKHFPLVLGQTFGFEYLPDLEAFMTTSPTLRESSRVFEWLQLLMNPNLRMKVCEQGETATLRLEWEPRGTQRAYHWFVEATFVSVLKFGRALLNGRGDFMRLHLQQARPGYAEQLESAVALPIRYRQAHNALEIAAPLLDIRLGGASEMLHRHAEQRVSQRLSEHSPASDLSTRLRHLFERRPELLSAGIGQAAESLRLHPRTLQRRLIGEQIRFAELQSSMRMQLAMRWLSDDSLDIEQISQKLGYSDRRSFTRAFSRWAGLTPSDWRKSRPAEFSKSGPDEH